MEDGKILLDTELHLHEHVHAHELGTYPHRHEMSEEQKNTPAGHHRGTEDRRKAATDRRQNLRDRRQRTEGRKQTTDNR
jgi:hypothetical protein